MGHSNQNRVGFRIDAHRQGADPHIAEITTIVGPIENTEKGIQNFNSLNEVQQEQFRNLMQVQIQLCDNTLYQYSLGLIGGEQMLQAARRVEMAYGFWEHMTEYTPPHVKRCYEEHKRD